MIVTVVHNIEWIAIGHKVVIVAPNWMPEIAEVHDISKKGDICVSFCDQPDQNDLVWVGQSVVQACLDRMVIGDQLYALLLVEDDE